MVSVCVAHMDVAYATHMALVCVAQTDVVRVMQGVLVYVVCMDAAVLVGAVDMR